MDCTASTPLRSRPEAVAAVPGAITARIAARFGYRVPGGCAQPTNWPRSSGANPFLAEGAAETTLHVLFLADRPAACRVAALDPDRSPPDAFIARGRAVYRRLPNGAGRTKLTTDYFDGALATTSTQRNWRTVTTLLALLGG